MTTKGARVRAARPEDLDVLVAFQHAMARETEDLERRLHEFVRALAARDPEVCGLRLYVERNNRSARATYRSLGLQETAYRVYEQATRGRE